MSGLEVSIEGQSVYFDGRLIGTLAREQRFEQWFWRAFHPETGEPFKRFFTTRPEAIQLLLINADALDGLGF